MSHSNEQHNDKSAAFTGLLVTALTLAAIVFGIVTWTNARYAGEKPGGNAAESSH